MNLQQQRQTQQQSQENHYQLAKVTTDHSNNFLGRSPERRNSQNYSQNRYSRSISQNNQYKNNYFRSISSRNNYSNFNRNRIKVQEVFFSHYIETIQNIQIDKIKTLEVVHQNIDDKSIR